MPSLQGHFPTSSGRCGFTLVELLVVMAVIAVIVLLIFPVAGSALEKSRNAKSIANMKQIATAIYSNAADKNGRWEVIEPHVMHDAWSWCLSRNGYLDSTKGTFDPSYPPKDYLRYQTYGVNWQGVAAAPDNQNVIEIEPVSAVDGPRRKFEIKLMAINKPSKYLLLADSVTTRFANLPQYHIVQGNSGMDEIHLRRPGERANILFADGHVEAYDKDQLREIGWRRAFSKDGKPITF